MTGGPLPCIPASVLLAALAMVLAALALHGVPAVPRRGGADGADDTPAWIPVAMAGALLALAGAVVLL